MTHQDIRLLHTLDQKLLKILRQWESDSYCRADAVDKLTNLESLITPLQLAFQCQGLRGEPYKEKLRANLLKAKDILNLGDIDFDSEWALFGLLKETRVLTKGLSTLMELLSLDEDEDIPEYFYESLEPFVDIDTGEVSEGECQALEQAILFQLSRAGTRALDYQDENTLETRFHATVEALENLNLAIDENLEVELEDGLKAFAHQVKGKRQEQAHMNKALSFYFEPTHQARTQSIAQSAQSLYKAPKSLQSNIPKLTAGELIIASAEALRSVYLMGKDLKDHEEKLLWDNLSISIRRKPSKKNIGNLVIRSVGRYGYKDLNKKTKKDILDDFEDIIEHCGRETFIQVLGSYGSHPFDITLDMLNLPNTQKGKQTLTKLQQDFFLIFCAELFRYFPIEQQEACPSSKKIPFAIALGLGLELLKSEKLQLEDLFDKDAPYGLPTGTLILDKTPDIHHKLNALLDAYQEQLEDEYASISQFKEMYPDGYICHRPLHFLRLLEQTFGHNLKTPFRMD